MNIVKELKDHGVNIDVIIFTQFPFGTSNDLSRAFNWGAKPSRRMKNNLEYLCNTLNDAKEVLFDIWEINVITSDEAEDDSEINPDEGNIRAVNGRNIVPIAKTHLQKLMCHSFSFGIDARVGINFELKRTRHRLCNVIRYGLEGLKRLF